jgi:acid phosphatase type 7
MGKGMRCDPAGRIRQRKDWSVLITAATAVGAALLILSMYDSSSAGARTTRSPVLVGAGDITSCESRGDRATAKLLRSISGTVLAAGDNAYENGSLSEYNTCYARTWGRFKERTKPIVGNHEYGTPGASGYFDYFSATPSAPVPNTKANPGLTPGKGYYSYNRGDWHIVALNSECEYVTGGCAQNSPMLTWLMKDLADNPARCTLAYFHRPRFSSGQNGNDATMGPIWNVLYAADADVVISGHDHVYERFARQTPRGVQTKQGIREFVVGTGGASHGEFRTIEENSQVRNADTYGVLKLTLHPRSYNWEFVPVEDKTFTDSGYNKCN